MSTLKKIGILQMQFAFVTVFFLLTIAPAFSSTIEGLSVNTYDGLILNSISISTIIESTGNMTMAINSQFQARGTQPMVDLSFATASPTSNQLENATVLIDLVGYYTSSGAKNIEWGAYFNRFSIAPVFYSNEGKYRIDLGGETDRVLNHFSSTVANLTEGDVWFAGRFFIEGQFINSTSKISDKNYIRFPFTFGGNITAINLDFTFPEESDLTATRLNDADMTKILPNRVQASFSGTSLQSVSPEVYAEWKIPASPPETPLWKKILYDPVFLSVVTLIAGLILGRYPWVWIDKRRETKRLVERLIAELEGAKKSLKEHKSPSTIFYDSSFSKLMLLSSKTAELVRQAYDDIKAREEAGYPSLTYEPGESPCEHVLKELTKSINNATSALKKEIGK
jgi:hypothetical protein